MLRCLLLKELTILAFGDDLHHVILSYKPVEIMPEALPMIERHAECYPHTPL
jgi:hypothetical protein